MDNTQEKSKVIVTGFGPFGNYKVNASWQSVKLLSHMNIEEELGIELILKEIPVSYDYVTKHVPELWKLHKPLLVIHVGVSCIADSITLEQCAHKSGYSVCDVDNCLPSDGLCCYGNENKLQSLLNVQKICDIVNNKKLDISTCASTNAGRYLCEFVYYTSLSINSGRTLFIHVPELDSPYSAKQIAEGLKEIIKTIVKKLTTVAGDDDSLLSNINDLKCVEDVENNVINSSVID